MAAVTRAPLLGLIALVVSPCAFCLNPSLDIGQYAHSSWKIGDGFMKKVVTSNSQTLDGYRWNGFLNSAVHAISQTPDGYIWLGTAAGLSRFDGVRQLSWTPPHGQQLPGAVIRQLLTTRDGTLWIGTDQGLASWRDAKLARYQQLDNLTITSLLEDRQGTIWVGARGHPAGRLCAIREGAVKCYGADGQFAAGVLALSEYGGDLCVGADTGLWRLTPGGALLQIMPEQPLYMMEGQSGALWIANLGAPRLLGKPPVILFREFGLRQLMNGRVEPNPLPIPGEFIPRNTLRDHDGGLWIATYGQGLVHLHEGKTDSFGSSDGLTGDSTTVLFEDKESNIWVGTTDGLDRFHDLPVATIATRQGVSATVISAILAAKDGTMWIATDDGLKHWINEKTTVYRKASSPVPTRPHQQPISLEIRDDGLPDNFAESLFEDERGRIWVGTAAGLAYFEKGRFTPAVSGRTMTVHGIVEDNLRNLWVDDLASLIRLQNGKVIEEIPWTKISRMGVAWTLAADPVRGGLWLGFQRGGLAYWSDGKVQASYSASDGLGAGRVSDIGVDRDGAVWAATDSGVSRLKNGRITTLTSKNGLPCDVVHWRLEDDSRDVWLGLACGLANIARSEFDAWIADSRHILKVTVFDSSDGVKSYPHSGPYSPHAIKSADGRLWSHTGTSLSVIDPRHLLFNNRPPPVSIEQITVNRKPLDGAADMGSPLHLPALIRDLQFDYTALSLIAPEKIQFRYKLEGHDRDWIDAGSRRQAFYNDLEPRNYRFHVQACNNSGVWNEAGASLDFSVAPMYYQTRWFQALCLLAAGAFIWVLYRLRLRQMTTRINLLHNERLAERTRIARDLHDTLLQSLAGVSLQLHGISKTAATAPEKTSSQIDKIRQQVDTAFREARMRVYNLRSPAFEGHGLTEALNEFIERLGPTATARCALHVAGEPVAVAPEIEEELLRIAQEAANNANRHAGANQIRIDIEYIGRSLKFSVSDDGRGFHLEEGLAKTGHWGLKNMQERAAHLAGKCTITSAPGNGTKVEVEVPLRRWSLRKKSCQERRFAFW